MTAEAIVDDFLAAAGEARWKIELRRSRELPAVFVEGSSFHRRHRALSGGAQVEFLTRVASCVNPEETAWFLCERDYRGAGRGAFVWDECERISLDAMAGDVEECGRIRAFWDKHLPVFFSVKAGDYDHLAMRTSGEFGSIVHGKSPEFEDVSPLCGSFDELLGVLTRMVRGHAPTASHEVLRLLV